MNTYEGKFHILEEKAPNRADGAIQLIEFDAPYSQEEHVKLVQFGFGKVKAIITEDDEEVQNPLTLEAEFELIKADRKHLKTGSRLRFLLRKSYEKDLREQLIRIEYKDVKVFLEKIQQELFEEEDEEAENE